MAALEIELFPCRSDNFGVLLHDPASVRTASIDAPEVAEALGVAESTVKTHLGRVYEKTGAGRQADLVKLVVGFANPLAA